MRTSTLDANMDRIVRAAWGARKAMLADAISFRRRFEPANPDWWLIPWPIRTDKIDGEFRKRIDMLLAGDIVRSDYSSDIAQMKEIISCGQGDMGQLIYPLSKMRPGKRILFTTYRYLQHWWKRERDGSRIYHAYMHIPQLLAEYGFEILYRDLDEGRVWNFPAATLRHLWPRFLRFMLRPSSYGSLRLRQAATYTIDWLRYTAMHMRIGRVIEESNPAAIVEHGAPNSAFSRSLAWWGRAMKIPVIQIPTYFVSPFRMSFVLDRAETEGLNGIPLARWYAVYGDQCRSVLENSGVPKEGIRVVGLHRLDGMLQQVKKGGFNRTEIRGKYGIPKGSGVVLIATQTYEESPKLIEETWLALQLGNHATTPILWIKPHPNYPMNDILARVKEKHKSGKELRHVLFDKTANLHELMCAADIVVTTFSTSGLEAMALGAPTVWANFAGLSSLLNPDLFTQFGLHCNDRTSFRDRLMLLLQQPENRAKVGDQCLKDVPKLLGPLDGLASRRTADLIAMAANA